VRGGQTKRGSGTDQVANAGTRGGKREHMRGKSEFSRGDQEKTSRGGGGADKP